jgi:hypothetical protein
MSSGAMPTIGHPSSTANAHGPDHSVKSSSCVPIIYITIVDTVPVRVGRGEHVLKMAGSGTSSTGSADARKVYETAHLHTEIRHARLCTLLRNKSPTGSPDSVRGMSMTFNDSDYGVEEDSSARNAGQEILHRCRNPCLLSCLSYQQKVVLHLHVPILRMRCTQGYKTSTWEIRELPRPIWRICITGLHDVRHELVSASFCCWCGWPQAHTQTHIWCALNRCFLQIPELAL